MNEEEAKTDGERCSTGWDMPSTQSGLVQLKCIEQPDQQARWLDWCGPAKQQERNDTTQK